MKPDLLTVSMWSAALLPALGLLAWLEFERRRRQATEKPPQAERLLRPPGHSLFKRLEELQDAVLSRVLFACALCAFAGLGAALLGNLFALHAETSRLAFVGVIFAAFVLTSILMLFRVFRLFSEFQNVRLGLRGEQAVAEALHETAAAGVRIFHDLEAEKIGNIDHIAVGERGVFVIETKARRRRASRNGKPEHVVVYDGKTLQFPSGTDFKAVGQAERNARWLADYLTKKTGEPVKTQPVVVVPGWFVETGGNFPVKVMNAAYLGGYLRRENEKIEAAQVRRIIAALDEKCRDVEF
jgi:hypothetical protein